MKTIRYEFNDGTVSEVEVSDELYTIHEQMVMEEKRNHKRETRRHTSLDYLNDKGIDFEAENNNPLDLLIKLKDNADLQKAMTFLSDKQRELVEKVFFEDMSLRQLAKDIQISHQALSQQMATIYQKLKKLL